MNAPLSLGEALRALPQLGPGDSAWPQMLERLQREPRRNVAAARPRTGRRAWAAVAAALVVAFSAMLAFRPQRTPAPDAGPVTRHAATESAAGASLVHNVANSTNSHDASSAAAGLAALLSRSRSLERWLRDTGAASAPQSTQDLAASAEIEDMIGLVDVQLGAADPADANATLPLWRRRVALLEDLSTLRYSANALSLRNGVAVNDASANRMNATPAVWRN